MNSGEGRVIPREGRVISRAFTVLCLEGRVISDASGPIALPLIRYSQCKKPTEAGFAFSPCLAWQSPLNNQFPPAELKVFYDTNCDQLWQRLADLLAERFDSCFTTAELVQVRQGEYHFIILGQ